MNLRERGPVNGPGLAEPAGRPPTLSRLGLVAADAPNREARKEVRRGGPCY